MADLPSLAAHFRPPPPRPWLEDPVAFAESCVAWPAGQDLTPYQADALVTLARDQRLAIRSTVPFGLRRFRLRVRSDPQ